jgi:nicotinamide mononucleotide transporter
MELTTYIEIIGTVFSLVFLFLLIRRNRHCWPFGIISSVLSIYLFISVKLYSEAVLYSFYVVFGFYGWWNWTLNQKKQPSDYIEIDQIGYKDVFFYVVLGTCSAVAIGYFWANFSDADFPYIDATTTSFALIATWMEAKRVFQTWYFWIILNTASIALYFVKGLPIYAFLMVIYTIMSLWGWLSWRKELKSEEAFVSHNS